MEDRFPCCRLNIYSRPTATLTLVHEALRGTPEFDCIRNSCLELYDIPVARAPISCKLIHALLTRQWISNQLRLTLILILECFLIAKTQTHRPTPRYVRLVDDLDAFLCFSRGRESFWVTIASMIPMHKTFKRAEDPVSHFAQQLKQETYRMQGFPLVLQLVTLRCVPTLVAKVPETVDNLTLLYLNMLGLSKHSALLMNEVLEAEAVLVVHSSVGNDTEEVDVWGEWDDEVRDKKVLYMLGLLKNGQQFQKLDWPSGDNSQPLIRVEP
ncbi:hypothetical protein EUTSA_v10015776mg [Eutrema salsugineum]|uniref:Uncharacterized protein n=1 Tax=Eutrema salsugineum TaxID=72664 RepID=V4LUT5_EUTSA|nr:hypothetical protein EUTSA_v10015776mg [Eutrema salsugineum]